MSGKNIFPTLETMIKLLEDGDTKAMTLTEIRERYGVHKSTVSKIEKKSTASRRGLHFIQFPAWSWSKRMRTGKMEDVE